jgi:hypothetical protein
VRAPFASILMLLSLAGCRQPMEPIQSFRVGRLDPASASLASQPRLILSVKAQAHVVATGWILVVTFGMKNPGNEPVVIGVGVPVGFLQLDIDDSDGERVTEYRFGLVWPPSDDGFPIGAKQTVAYTIEIPTPVDPGSYRLTLSIAGRPETSPPCVVQIVPPRDANGRRAGL